MPDLTIEIMQQCSARARVIRGNVGGYQQEIYPNGLLSCTCKAFMYRKDRYGMCKHLRKLDAETCSYHEQFDGPPETDGTCPKCGAATEYVRVAV